MNTLTCKHCGIELDGHDVDANLSTWDVFRNVCTDCVEVEDNTINPPKQSAAVWGNKVIFPK